MSETVIKQPLLVIVTGMSGAGRSVAINALEDIGFNCIDNLPAELILSVTEFFKKSGNNGNIAIGMDIRNENFIGEFLRVRSDLEKQVRLDVVFIAADEEVVTTRYGATRRKHPLLDSGGQLLAAIRRERTMLAPLEQAAHVSFNTSHWSPHQLARVMEERYQTDSPGRQLHVSVFSFGFKHGAPRPVDLLFDVRFLKNPYFEPELKTYTGLDKAVRDFVLDHEDAQEFLAKLKSMNDFLLPRYFAEGKHYLRIGIGCTGGQHRSVAVAEWLGAALQEDQGPNFCFSVVHRDIHLRKSIQK